MINLLDNPILNFRKKVTLKELCYLYQSECFSAFVKVDISHPNDDLEISILRTSPRFKSSDVKKTFIALHEWLAPFSRVHSISINEGSVELKYLDVKKASSEEINYFREQLLDSTLKLETQLRGAIDFINS